MHGGRPKSREPSGVCTRSNCRDIPELSRAVVSWCANPCDRWACGGRLFKALGQTAKFLRNKRIGALGGSATAKQAFIQQKLSRCHCATSF
jgi:hypothetical protein